MYKVLLGGVLVASMFSSTANAELNGGGYKSISGWGCAVAKKNIEKDITLNGNDDFQHKGPKGVIKAGTIITREVKFYYDFKDSVECGKANVWIQLTSLNHYEEGVDLLTPLIGLKFNLDGGVSGHKTIEIKYRVKSPDAWKLTSKFHYKHEFKMTAKID